MKNLLIFCFVLVSGVKAISQEDFVSITVEALRSSELSIKGDTNISRFECVFSTFFLEDGRKVAFKKKADVIYFNNAILSLKNQGFDCGNRAINKDFHILLNSKEYPRITMELLDIKMDNPTVGKAHVKISIAGKSKEYRFPVKINSRTMDFFSGKLKLNIRDFDLQAPKKMLGLIVIKEEIEIDFNLVVKLG